MDSQLIAWMISLGAWNWFILAALLFLLEIIAPGSFMMWLGLSAIVVGAISVFIDWSWQAQLIAFAVFAVAAIPAWRHFARKVERPVERPFLNRRAEGYVGREFTLDKPIVGGVGTHAHRRYGLARAAAPIARPAAASRSPRTDGANLTVEAA